MGAPGYVHCIVPGGGLSPDGSRWIACRRGFFLPVLVLSRLFRRLMLQRLLAAHAADRLAFFGDLVHLANPTAFQAHLKPLWRAKWMVYAKRPFAGPEQVLNYLARYTHRVAIANSRLIVFDGARVTFKVKNYRQDGAARYGTLTLESFEFIRRFLLHVLPNGFHRIRHVGFLANGVRAEALGKARAALNVAAPAQPAADHAAEPEPPLIATCRCCGGRLVLVETLPRPQRFRCAPMGPQPIDSS